MRERSERVRERSEKGVHANIRLGWKWLSPTNALAYSIAVVKSFIGQAL